jgi:hypothetical protein
MKLLWYRWALGKEEEGHEARALAHERQEKGDQQVPHEQAIERRVGKR